MYLNDSNILLVLKKAHEDQWIEITDSPLIAIYKLLDAFEVSEPVKINLICYASGVFLDSESFILVTYDFMINHASAVELISYYIYLLKLDNGILNAILERVSIKLDELDV